MEHQLQNIQIANFVHSVTYEQIGTGNIDQLKRHLLDSLGSLLHATQKPAIHKLVRQLRQLSDGGACRVPILGRLPLDRAGQLFTALIRYPDFMDNYLGKESTCHPSDNIGPLLAASQINKSSGKDFLRSMATSYQVECRLVEEIPVMIEGIDHTLLLSFSIVAGVSQLLGLSIEQTAHALAIAGCSISPMATSRASYTYEWKGFASSFDALNCLNTALLAKENLTGPIALFEGPKGFKEIFNMKLDYDWSKEDFSLIKKCVMKRYNAEVHSQSAIHAIYELKKHHNIPVDEIEKITITVFLTCYHIIGSGAYGDRKKVETKEQADHSLFYLAAVALLDDDIFPGQFEPKRINKTDVQELLQKVEVRTSFPLHKPTKVAGVLDPYTASYPKKMKSKVEITLKNGNTISNEQEDYPGFNTKPFSWEQTIEKFNRLTGEVISQDQKNKIINVVQQLENEEIESLLDLICIK